MMHKRPGTAVPGGENPTDFPATAVGGRLQVRRRFPDTQ